MDKVKLFHYTPEVRIDDIIASGEIQLATASVYDKREKPCAWVSSNQHWEETATKQMNINGQAVQLTFKEQLENFGCARIEVKPAGFNTWGKLKYLAKMNLAFASEMERVGISQGGNPKEWFGSMQPITTAKWIKAEVYKNGEWIEYKVFN
jgi:hypothetical protein